MSAWNAILAGSSYFTKSRMDLYVYKTIHQSWWALHLNNDTSYSAMSVAEWQTGTATNARTVRADYLKQIIEYHAGNLDSQLNIPTKTSQLTNDSWFIDNTYHDSTKQDNLTTQTAYSAKWTTTKVPQITTNTLWQVTWITEKNIAFPVTSVNWSTWAITWLQTTGNLKTSLSDNSDSYYPSQKAVKTAVDWKQDKLTAGEWITIDENNVISAEWWGGADTNTINALIDVKLKDSDPVFQITSGLYKILNAIDEEDEC